MQETTTSPTKAATSWTLFRRCSNGGIASRLARSHRRLADTAHVLRAISTGTRVPADLVPDRSPRSADVDNSDLVRMVVGGVALVLLGTRRYALRRPPVLGPSSRLLTTGVTIFTGYPSLNGALRSLSAGKGAGTDTQVTTATAASLVLRGNVVWRSRCCGC